MVGSSGRVRGARGVRWVHVGSERPAADDGLRGLGSARTSLRHTRLSAELSASAAGPLPNPRSPERSWLRWTVRSSRSVALEPSER